MGSVAIALGRRLGCGRNGGVECRREEAIDISSVLRGRGISCRRWWGMKRVNLHRRPQKQLDGRTYLGRLGVHTDSQASSIELDSLSAVPDATLKRIGRRSDALADRKLHVAHRKVR